MLNSKIMHYGHQGHKQKIYCGDINVTCVLSLLTHFCSVHFLQFGNFVILLFFSKEFVIHQLRCEKNKIIH